MMTCSTSARSSLELMLDAIRQRDEQPTDAPPALPVRPVSKARLPPSRRGLPVNFRKCGLREDVKEKEDRRREEGESNFKLGVFESKRLKIELLDVTDDQRERLLEGILEIQKYFRGHQARCYYIELKRGTVALQSFIRGWLIRRCLNKGNNRLPGVEAMEDKRKLDWRNQETKELTTKLDHRKVTNIIKSSIVPKGITFKLHRSALPDLQRRLLRAETEMEQKEEENAVLRQKLQQFDEKWLQYEAKMKSMEKTWQDQLTSLQMSLVAANPMPVGTQATNGRRELDFSDRPCDTEPQEINSELNDINQLRDQLKKVFHDNANIVGKLKPVHLASISMSPDHELRKLKLRFESWKKDYRARLQETKATLQKLGRAEPKNNRTKWWGR
ncbi:P-loop containing nucleoside triphosphate hydrolases superfamily protein [Actinidia rufa]|uniref:P-loop containing nucleoside triphosphate hydrolases superfamily protein n=1 Tax=Actinidia rufa TaxID=165716 RepID=A0A7J0FYX0_9ERIC|nr:P-loop containing nucleoside triphosphate hydrolases superfamily protein [Actinidia rufa]